jgi:MoaA/NifB/PqqE/SkfB family radical SAM enzyme
MRVVIEITDTSLLMVFLLEECDLDCPHCVRPDEPMEPGYRLTFEQLERALRDATALPSLDWIHFSGGEPTLWAEEGRDLADLLLAISAAGFDPGFTTNGNVLAEGDGCERILGRYLAGSAEPLRLYLSIDSFHGNFDRRTGRAPALDRYIEFRDLLPAERAGRLVTTVLSVVTNEPDSSLPEEMVAHYESRGLRFTFVPLRPMGRARAMADLCPERETGVDRALSLILIGDDYWLHREGASDPDRAWRKVGTTGALPGWIVDQHS